MNVLSEHGCYVLRSGLTMANLQIHFEETAQTLLAGERSLGGRWSLTRRDRSIELVIPAVDAGGFEVGAVCETWGILPRAGKWEDCPWEPHEWSVEEMCAAFFGLLRSLLSADGRLRIRYSRGRASRPIVELLNADGWSVFDPPKLTTGPDLLPHEVVLQNNHLPSRFPFAGLTPTVIGTYSWDAIDPASDLTRKHVEE